MERLLNGKLPKMNIQWTSELIGFLVQETGWTLKYIGKLPCKTALSLALELNYLKDCDRYETSNNFAFLIASIFNGLQNKRHYRIEDFMGNKPRRKHKGGIVMVETTPMVVTLADGKEYTISPLDMNDMVDVEVKFNKPFAKLFAGDETSIAFCRYLVFCSLRHKYPDITEQMVGALITAKIFGEEYPKIATFLMG